MNVSGALMEFQQQLMSLSEVRVMTCLAITLVYIWFWLRDHNGYWMRFTLYWGMSMTSEYLMMQMRSGAIREYVIPSAISCLLNVGAISCLVAGAHGLTDRKMSRCWLGLCGIAIVAVIIQVIRPTTTGSTSLPRMIYDGFIAIGSITTFIILVVFAPRWWMSTPMRSATGAFGVMWLTLRRSGFMVIDDGETVKVFLMMILGLLLLTLYVVRMETEHARITERLEKAVSVTAALMLQEARYDGSDLLEVAGNGAGENGWAHGTRNEGMGSAAGCAARRGD